MYSTTNLTHKEALKYNGSLSLEVQEDLAGLHERLDALLVRILEQIDKLERAAPYEEFLNDVQYKLDTLTETLSGKQVDQAIEIANMITEEERKVYRYTMQVEDFMTRLCDSIKNIKE